MLDYCDAGQKWDPLTSAYFYRFHPSTSGFTRIFNTDSPEEGSNATSFLYFTGLWGDFQYPNDHPRQKTVPYFGLKRFVSGPTGPMAKQLVRKGLFPDHRARKSWLQWAVGVFMWLYPCCFRGWRAWVTGIVLVGMLVSLVFGVRLIFKKYMLRRMGYSKVGGEEDIPLNCALDDRARDSDGGVDT